MLKVTSNFLTVEMVGEAEQARFDRLSALALSVPSPLQHSWSRCPKLDEVDFKFEFQCQETYR
jgi:hypothetical protein